MGGGNWLDEDFGGPLAALVWVLIALLILCFFAMIVGSEDVAGRASSGMYAILGLLGTLVGVKTIAVSRRGERDSRRGGKDRDA
jgi:hypothetical protein